VSTIESSKLKVNEAKTNLKQRYDTVLENNPRLAATQNNIKDRYQNLRSIAIVEDGSNKPKDIANRLYTHGQESVKTAFTNEEGNLDVKGTLSNRYNAVKESVKERYVSTKDNIVKNISDDEGKINIRDRVNNKVNELKDNIDIAIESNDTLSETKTKLSSYFNILKSKLSAEDTNKGSKSIFTRFLDNISKISERAIGNEETNFNQDSTRLLTSSYAEDSLTLLERIAIGVENIKSVSGEGITSTVSTKPKGLFRKTLGLVTGGLGKLNSGRKLIRNGLSPIRKGLFSALKSIIPLGIKSGFSLAGFGIKTGLGILKSATGLLTNTAKKLPGILVKTVGGLFKAGKTTAKILSAPAALLGRGLLAAGKFGANRLINTATKLPGRLATGFNIGKSIIGGTAKGTGAVLSTIGKLINPDEESRLSILGNMASSIKEAPSKLISKLFSKSDKKESNMSPFSMFGSLVDKLQSKKEDKVVTILTSILNYIKKAFPVEDSETKEANRVGGVNDLFRRREASKKAKEEFRASKTATKAGLGTGLLGLLSGKHKTEDEESDESEDGLFGKAKNFIKEKFNISDEHEDAIETGMEVGAGGLLLKNKLINAGKNIYKGVAKLPVAVKTGASYIPKLATGARLAAAVTSGSIITSASASLAGTGATIAGLVSNPVGWTILAAAAIAATAYGGYQGYRYLTRRSKLKPLELLRFLQYGVAVDNKQAVADIRYFEENIEDHIEISKSGIPKIKLTSEELWEEFYDNFGGVYDDKYQHKNFINWFYKRFLPIYVKHTLVAKALNNTKLIDVDDNLTASLKLVFVNKVQFGTIEAEVGMDPYSITSSPWKDIALSDNLDHVRTLTEQIRNDTKRGVDTSLNNLESINKTVPALAPITVPKVEKLPDNYDKLNELSAKNITNGDNISVTDRLKSFYQDKLITPVSQGIEDFVEGSKATYNAGSEFIGKGVDWTKTHIFEPIKDSLAGIIQAGESGKKGYNAYNRGTLGNKILGPVGDRNLTNMTLSEILDDMQRSKSDTKRLFAVGKYQMIPDTLKEGIRSLKIDPSATKYDPKIQELLFSKYLLDKKRPAISAYIKGKSDDAMGAAASASYEWASIGNPKKGGRGNYGGGNHVSISAEKILNSMHKSRELYKTFIAQGLSDDEAYQKAVSSDASAVEMAAVDTTNTPLEKITPTTEAKTTPVVATNPTTEALPVTNNSQAATLAVPTFNGYSKAKNTNVNIAPTTKTNKTVQNPFVASPVIKDTPEDKTVGLPKNTNINVYKTSIPDFSPISSTVEKSGLEAAKQRYLQIAEQEKTNLLLQQLLASKKETNEKESKVNLTNNFLSSPQQSVKPVVNLNRGS
jgi:hypothetical protein